jgi:single-strand DNA-binding protein
LTPSLGRHAAALKAVAASAATRLDGDANPAPGQPPVGRARKDPPRSNETTITITGNLVDGPDLRFTPGGQAFARFRIASTPRYRDSATAEWKDGDTVFLTCVAWRRLAENIAESLEKGMRVIATGRLRQRSYEAQEGGKRTMYELQVDEAGPALSRATVRVTRVSRSGNGGPVAAA